MTARSTLEFWGLPADVLAYLPPALSLRGVGPVSGRAAWPVASTVDGIRVIAIEGVLLRRQSPFRSPDFSDIDRIESEIRDALANPSIKGIVLAVDSPGGTIGGIQSLASNIRAWRSRKPIVAWTDGMMLSSAYWLCSAADKIFISGDTTRVGGIGVVTKHVDVSKAEERLGVKTTEIYAGKYKVLGSQFQPLDDDARAELQRMVDAIYRMFVDAVAQHRGTTVRAVVTQMGEGRILLGREAIRAGLVDGVRPLGDIVDELRTRGRVR